jgi:hypothetical protein
MNFKRVSKDAEVASSNLSQQLELQLKKKIGINMFNEDGAPAPTGAPAPAAANGDAEIANLNQQLGTLLQKKSTISAQAAQLDVQINTVQQNIAKKLAAGSKPAQQKPQQPAQPQPNQGQQAQPAPTASVAPPAPGQGQQK